MGLMNVSQILGHFVFVFPFTITLISILFVKYIIVLNNMKNKPDFFFC